MSKIVGTVLYRLDSWALGLALRAALEWCDELIVAVHEPGGGKTDPGWEIIKSVSEKHPGRISVCHFTGDAWAEMEMRQEMLRCARNSGASHVAIVDSDEAVTADLIPTIRGSVLALKPGEALDLPMVSTHYMVSGFDLKYLPLCIARVDGNYGSARITLAFGDRPDLAWSNAADGYCYHARKPKGIGPTGMLVPNANLSGIFHLQYASLSRLRAKAAYYKMIERLQFPNRPESSPDALNLKYDWTLGDASRGSYEDIPEERWLYPFGDGRAFVDLSEAPWQAWGCLALWNRHGESGVFDGLVLHESSWRHLETCPAPVFRRSLAR